MWLAASHVDLYVHPHPHPHSRILILHDFTTSRSTSRLHAGFKLSLLIPRPLRATSFSQLVLLLLPLHVFLVPRGNVREVVALVARATPREAELCPFLRLVLHRTHLNLFAMLQLLARSLPS